jgi:uncharacterized protein YuzE
VCDARDYYPILAMNITYDKTIDAIYIHLNKGRYAKSKKVTDDILVDVNKQGKVLGMEILDASKNITAFKPNNLIINWETLPEKSSRYLQV